MAWQQQLEAKMDEMFVKNAPFHIPKGGKDAIVKYLPIISLVVGILSLLAALPLYHLVTRTNELADTLNDYARAYGVDAGYNDTNYFFAYIALAFLIVQGLLFLYAYPGLKAQTKKKGWDILLYGILLSAGYNAAYAIYYLVNGTGGSAFGSIISGIIGLIIGLYFAAQLKGHYSDHAAKAPAKK